MMHQHFEFDPLNHSATINEQTISLNPLSFKLLELLHNASGNTVSVNEIMDTVWQDKQVSPESLKQRVFVLRKAITEAGIEGVTIQSIRGEGYRLIVEKASVPITHKEPKAPKHLLAASVMILTIIAFLLAWHWPFNQSKYVNNRVALWTNIESTRFSGFESSVYERWHQLLSEDMAANKLNLVLSNKLDDLLVPVQSRKDRIAVISYFQVLSDGKTTIVNMSLVEPRTATLLRNDRLEINDEENVENVLLSQLKGIHQLIESGKLNLTKAQKDNANYPIWIQLKALANAK